MHYLAGRFQKVIAAVKKHPFLVLLVFVLQVALLGISLYTALTYQVKILQDAQGIIEPLQNANYDADSIKAGQAFTGDILGIYNSYQSLITNLLTLALWLIVFFLFLNGIIWLLSHQVMETAALSWKERVKAFFRGWLRYAITSIVILGPFFALSYFFLRNLLLQDVGVDSFTMVITVLMYVLLVLYYFLLVAFAFLQPSSWKLFLRKVLTASLKKIHFTLLVLIVNSVVLFASLYGVYYFMNHGEIFSGIMVFSILFLLLLVITRLFWIACLQEITYEKDHS